MEQAAETVTINGTTYEVETPEMHEAAGRVNTARHMRSHASTRSLLLKRPQGNIAYSAHEFTGGRYSKVVSLGFGWRS